MTDDQAATYVKRHSYAPTPSERVNRDPDLEALRQDPALLRALEAALAEPKRGTIWAIRALRMKTLVPAVMRLAERADVAGELRCEAALAAWFCDGDGEDSRRWIRQAVDTLAFRAWNLDDQRRFLDLLPLLPPAEVLACVDEIDRWIAQEHVGAREFPHSSLPTVRANAAWCSEVERMPQEVQVKAIVDGMYAQRPVLRLARDPKRQPLVIVEARTRTSTREDKRPLELLDDLDATLTDTESLRLRLQVYWCE